MLTSIYVPCLVSSYFRWFFVTNFGLQLIVLWLHWHVLQVLERGQVASHWAALHWAAFNVTQKPAGSSKTTKTSWIHQGIISVAFFGASGLWIQEWAVFNTLWRVLYTPNRFRRRFCTSSTICLLASADASVLTCICANLESSSIAAADYHSGFTRWIWTTKTQALHLVDHAVNLCPMMVEHNHCISYMLSRGSSAKRLVNKGSARPFAGLPRLQCQLPRRYWSWRV